MLHNKKLFIKTSLFIFVGLWNLSLHAQINPPADTSYFVSWDDDYNLLLAVDKGDIAAVSFLLDRGADPNSSTIEGVTPLMYATESGFFEIVKLLVEKGADINKKPFTGPTALISAAERNHYEIAEYFASKKANLDIRDSDGATAVNHAAALNNYDVMDMLIFYGANPEIADSKGNTPLISAAYNNSLEAAGLLIEHGVAIDTTDIYGFTALMTAVQRGNSEIVYLLIDKGANIGLVNSGGYSALTFAVINGDAELTETLINLGSDVNTKTESGYTILELAKLKKEDVIAELLESNEAKPNPNPHFNTLCIGPYLDFNFSDYMNGLNISIKDAKYGIGINGGFGFRPLSNRVLYPENDSVTYQYWERRYYFYAGLEKRFNFTRNSSSAKGLYVGIDEFYTFGGFLGSDKNPPATFLTVPVVGLYYSGSYVSSWLAYKYVNYNTPEVKPGRINLGVSVNLSLAKKKLTEKKISWLE
ncbi:MAG: ankyrin repeat domain-containing protein [Bacteroidales bacterium]|nr:ankyrin repeat domain-containing protein [Bacteroidales bacterium]MCB9012940.1 ankyrin repeat domain-containing protein [Bacteroidales bacterium]